MSDVQPVPDRSLVYLEAVVFGLDVDVRVNDIPQTRLRSTEEPIRAWLPMPAYVQRGSNKLGFRFVTPPPPPAAGPPDENGPPEPYVNLRIGRFGVDEPAFENAGATLGKLIWSHRARADTAVAFESPLGPPSWSWSRCELLKVDAPTMDSVLGFVREIEAGYRRSDAAPFIAAAQPKIGDMDAAYPDRSRAEIIEVMSSVFSEAAPEQDVAPVAFAPQLCGDGRLLDCLGADGKAFARKRGPNGAQRYLSMVVGRLDGRWQVIR